MRQLPGGPAPRRRRLLAALVAAAVAVPVPLLVDGATAAPVAAAEGGGASTRVAGNGRIITWILFPDRRGGRRGGGVAREVWVTLGAAEISFLVHLLSARPDLVDDDPLVAALSAAVAGLGPDVDLQLLVRGGVPTTTVRTVPAAADGPAAWARRMVTVLPALRPTVTPPEGTAVPVGTPVFVSFPDGEWGRTVDRTLTAGGVSARVRARPVGVRLSSGDPLDAGRVITCDGPGRPFDPADPAGPRPQARRPGACTVTYRSATGVRGRRTEWFGEVTVLWDAEWSTDGTTWRPLGLVPRLSVVARRTGELGTAVDRP